MAIDRKCLWFTHIGYHQPYETFKLTYAKVLDPISIIYRLNYVYICLAHLDESEVLLGKA